VFDGTDIWVTSQVTDTVTVIDPSTDTVAATVALPSTSRGIASDGTSIWVANTGANTLSKIRP